MRKVEKTLLFRALVLCYLLQSVTFSSGQCNGRYTWDIKKRWLFGGEILMSTQKYLARWPKKPHCLFSYQKEKKIQSMI